MDYKKISKDDNEYFELFRSSGWEHMCSNGPFHFFSSSPEAVPIYTEKENYLSKYESIKTQCNKTAIISVSILVVVNIIGFLLGSKVQGSLVKNIVAILSIFSIVVALPSLMVSIAYYVNEKRVLKKHSKLPKHYLLTS